MMSSYIALPKEMLYDNKKTTFCYLCTGRVLRNNVRIFILEIQHKELVEKEVKSEKPFPQAAVQNPSPRAGGDGG